MNRWLAACLPPFLLMCALPISARAELCSYVESRVSLDGVDFQYPQFTLASSSVEQAVNAHLAADVAALFADWYQWPEGSHAEGGVLRVAVDEEQNVLSVLMNVHFDIAGAAHPYTMLYAENYSLDDGSALRPIDFLNAEQLASLIRKREVSRPIESEAEPFSQQLDYLSTLPGKKLDKMVANASVLWLPGESILVLLPLPHELDDYTAMCVEKERLIS